MKLPRLVLLPAVLATTSLAATAVPITLSNTGYWLETVGANTVGIAGGGSAAGVVRTLFVANTSPLAGTSAAADFSGTPTFAPVLDATGLWARGSNNPVASQLAPLTVTFTNGADTVSFTGRDLTGLSPLPLAQNLQVDASSDAFGPVIKWSLPASAGDYDVIQLVFYNDATNLEVGSRVNLGISATSYDITGPLPGSFSLVVNVRLIDLFDDNAPFTLGNVQRESRAYVSYLTPVPEPASAAMWMAGLALLATCARRRRG